MSFELPYDLCLCSLCLFSTAVCWLIPIFSLFLNLNLFASCGANLTTHMAGRHITNNYPDFDANSESDYLENNQFKPQLVSSANRLMNTLLMRINKNVYGFDRNSDYSIYTGYGGIGLLHYFNYLKRNSVESYDIAKYLTDKALSNLRGRDVSFLLGDAGPLALGALIYTKENNTQEVENLIVRLLKLPDRVSKFPDELLYGRAGYLYALLLVRKHLGNVIPEECIKKQINHLISTGTRTANKDNSSCPLKYVWHGENYLGAAHGLAGILYILLLNKDLLTEHTLRALIKPSLDWLISRRYVGGNFPSSEDSINDKLVQWCHGAPGFVNLFTLASEIYGSDKYMKIALECGEVVWNRGILMKGYSICHGVSGNAYTFSHLYQKTKNEKHLHRLACFLDWCNTYPNNEGMRPDRPLSMFEESKALAQISPPPRRWCTFPNNEGIRSDKLLSMFEGISGVTYFLLDVQDPLTAAFPAYALN